MTRVHAGWNRGIWKKYEESAIVIFTHCRNHGKTLLMHYSLNNKGDIDKILSFKKTNSADIETQCKDFELEIITKGV